MSNQQTLKNIVIETLALLDDNEKAQLTKHLKSRAKTPAGISRRLIKSGFSTHLTKPTYLLAKRILNFANIDQSRVNKKRQERLDNIFFSKLNYIKQQQEEEYNQAYFNFNYSDKSLFSEQDVNKGQVHKIDFMSEPLKRISRAFDFPFDTIIRLDNLTDEERNEMGTRLKAFYDKNIKTQPIDSKILVGYLVDGEWVMKPLGNKTVREVLEKMLKGDYVLASENVSTNLNFSDPEAFISLSFIDAIKFQIVENEKVDGQREREKPSGFFPYRLKQEYKQFEIFLNELAIGCELYDFNKKCIDSVARSTRRSGHIKPWLKQCCLIYAISQKYPEETELLEGINRLLNGSTFIAADKLTEIGNIFNIQFIVRSRDNKEGKLKKGNFSNDGVYGPKDAKYKVEIDRVEYHYFIHKSFPCSAFFIKNYKEIMNYGNAHGWSFNKCCLAYKRRGQRILIDTAKAKISSIDLVTGLMEIGAFEKILRSDRDVDLAGVHEWLNKSENTNETIKEIQEYNIKKLEKPKETLKKKAYPLDKKPNEKQQDLISLFNGHVFYADFETCTKENKEIAFMVCVQSINGDIKKTFKGFDCAEQLMEFLPNSSVVYFHNLGFDGRLLMKYGIKNNIMKGSKIITQKHNYKGKQIQFKDSYSIFPQALRTFPASFKKEFSGLNIQKELFPYRYYSYERLFSGCAYPLDKCAGVISECGNVEKPLWNEDQRKQFKENIDSIPGCKLGDDSFDMLLYCEFYCQQDVNVLRIGFNAFREAALKPPIEMDIFEITTAPALANQYLNNNVFYKDKDLYVYSGKLQDYIMGAVYGGRCMTKQNKRWLVINSILDDFDACSLYPSAMARLFTVSGKPEILSKEFTGEKIYDENNPHYLLKHAFKEDQLKPTEDRFISYFIVDIEIVNVGIFRDFAQIVYKDPITKTNKNVNEPGLMRVDLITLEDLVRFYKISYKVKGGIVFKGERSHRIREVIKDLFEKRAQYKREGNSIQQVMKLIMNSGYGKSIQKPIKTDTKFIPDNKLNHYIFEHYHNIDTIKKVTDSDISMITENKQLEKQFNNCIFGVSVLSMSKRIMNEVMCLAEDLKIPIYYQDTDSMHIEHDKIELLSNEFRKIYGRELIGENIMGRFHNDFDELKDAYCTFHVSLGKKMYYDALENDKGEHAEHFRMKGIPNDTIRDYANKHFNGNVKDLYLYLYEGNSITFDLNATKVNFKMEKTGEILHNNKFLRTVKATAPKA